MDTKHTPAPWVLNSFSTSIYSEGECIADIWSEVGKCEAIGYDQAQANAHLIAAAPDMYSMLESIYKAQGWSDVGELLAKARGEEYEQV